MAIASWGLSGTYQFKCADDMATDQKALWTLIGTATQTWRGNGSKITDTEALCERGFNSYEVVALAGGDGIRLPYANFGDYALGFSAGTAGQYPRLGMWLRCSSTSRTITINAVATDATTSTRTYAVTWANMWGGKTTEQLCELDVSGLNGKTLSYIEILVDGACTFWVGKIYWVNQTDVSWSGSKTSERLKTPNYCPGGIYVNCLFDDTPAGYMYSNGALIYIQGCLFKGGASQIILYYPGSAACQVTEASTAHLLTDSVNCWFLYYVRLDAYSAYTIRNVYFYIGAPNTTFFGADGLGGTYTYNWSNIYAYYPDRGLTSVVGKITVTNGKSVGGSYALWCQYSDGWFRAVNYYLSLTTPPSYNYSYYAGTSLNVSTYEDGTPTWGNNVPLPAFANTWINHTSVNFIVSPVTAGILVYGFPAITDTYYTPPSMFGVTDGSGKVSAWVKRFEGGYRTSKSWTAADPNGWVFYFLNAATGAIVGRYPAANTYNISNGIGTPSSPVTVDLATGLSISSPSISSATMTENGNVKISCTVSGSPTRGWVVFTNGSDNVIASKELTISGTNAYVTTDTVRIPAGTYSAGRIEIRIENDIGDSAKNETLSLTVTAATLFKTWQKNWIKYVRDQLRANSTLTGTSGLIRIEIGSENVTELLSDIDKTPIAYILWPEDEISGMGQRALNHEMETEIRLFESHDAAGYTEFDVVDAEEKFNDILGDLYDALLAIRKPGRQAGYWHEFEPTKVSPAGWLKLKSGHILFAGIIKIKVTNKRTEDGL